MIIVVILSMSNGTVNSFAQISSDILAEVGTVNSFAQISSDILAEV